MFGRRKTTDTDNEYPQVWSRADLLRIATRRRNQPMTDTKLPPPFARTLSLWARGETVPEDEARERAKLGCNIPSWDNATAGARLTELVNAGYLTMPPTRDAAGRNQYHRPGVDPTPTAPQPQRVIQWVPEHTRVKNVQLPSGDVIQVPETIPERVTVHSEWFPPPAS